MPPEHRVPDQALLRAAAGGDRECLAQLLDRYQGRLWRLLLRLTGGPQEAEDLLQETFVRVLRSYRTFSGHSSFATWMYAIALNVFRSRLRKQRRQTPQPVDLMAVSGTASPETSAEQHEAAEQVRRAVQSLPEQQRSAIILSRYEGMSYEQIAEIFGCSVDAVKQRVRRAMAHLRELLKGLE